MKILINGFHWGGNTPPFVNKFKELGHNVKLICPYSFNKQELFKVHALSNEIFEDDIIFPAYNICEIMILKILNVLSAISLKINFSLFLKASSFIKIRKISTVIKLFSPDIILNHSFSYQTYLVIKTGYKPQVSFPFGSEIMGNLFVKDHKMHDEIIKNSESIISPLPAFSSYLQTSLRVPSEKISDIIPLGLPNLNLLLKNNFESLSIYKNFKIPQNKILIIETRGLRRKDGGSLVLLKALSLIPDHNVHLILLKGYLGNSEVIKEAKKLVEDMHLKFQVTIIEDELSYKDMIALFKISDINVSLLPHDGLGKSIMEAISQKCLLILTDLQEYKIAFSNNSEYVPHESIFELKDAILRTINLNENEKYRRIQKNIEWLIDNQNFDTNCMRLLNLFEMVIRKHKML